MVGSFVRFFFTRCEESLNSLVRCAHSFVRASRNSWRKIVRTRQPWSNLYFCYTGTMLFHTCVSVSVEYQACMKGISWLSFYYNAFMDTMQEKTS